MFCHNCGEKLVEESSFCMKCGEKVNEQPAALEKKPPQETETNIVKPPSIEASQTPAVQSAVQTNKPTPKKKSNFNSWVPILIPIVSFVLVSILLVFIFLSEQKKNDSVLELQQTAENAALQGDYDAAINSLNEAKEMRPDYEILQLNLDEINRAKEFSAKIDQVLKLVANQEFEKAETDLITLKEQSASDTSPLFTSFHEKITAEEEKITIGKIKLEITDLNNVDGLASKLNELETMSSPDVETLKTEILDRIVEITNTEATEFLANNQFAEALNAVNKALSYKENDEQLLQLKEQIEQEKVAYEDQAAEEDLHNRTAAVELISFTANLEENGDITIDGTIKSTATVPIYTITVFYAVYDLEGNFLEEGYVYVEPDLLEPGDEGQFSGVIKGINQEATVEIFNVTWYFDQ